MEGKESQVQPKTCLNLAVKFEFKTRPIRLYHNSPIFDIIIIMIITHKLSTKLKS